MFENFWKALDKHELKNRLLDKLADPNSSISLENEWNDFFRANPNWVKENPEIAQRLISIKWEQFGQEIKKLKEMPNTTKKTISLDLDIHYPAEIIIKPDEVGFIAGCPALDVWSQGDSEAEAEENIKEALYLFLEVCWEKGTIGKVLKDCGIEFDHFYYKNRPQTSERK